MKEDILKITETILQNATYFQWSCDDKPTLIKCQYCGQSKQNVSYPHTTIKHLSDCVVLAAQRVQKEMAERKERRNNVEREANNKLFLDRVKAYGIEKMKQDACKKDIK